MRRLLARSEPDTGDTSTGSSDVQRGALLAGRLASLAASSVVAARTLLLDHHLTDPD
jgi:hypothetical protein